MEKIISFPMKVYKKRITIPSQIRKILRINDNDNILISVYKTNDKNFVCIEKERKGKDLFNIY